MDILIIVLQLLLSDPLHAKARQLPDVKPAHLDTFITSARFEANHRVPVELLVSLAWAESRFDSSAEPACGVMQVFPVHINRPQSDCAVWRADVRAAVRAGVIEMEMLLADKRVRGDVYRALMYRACGNAFFQGTCSAAKQQWVKAAIARWKWLSDSHQGSARS